MDKKLPKVFANNPNKNFNNNEKVFYSKDNKSDKIDASENTGVRNSKTKNIYQKINDIFNSEKYVYKADVEIQTNNGNIKTKVIGQNKTHLITFDNELIPITNIQDIKFIN